MNLENYIDDFDPTKLFKKLLEANKIQSDDNHLKTFMSVIKGKFENLKKEYKTKDYFKSFPVLDTDYTSHVIGNF